MNLILQTIKALFRKTETAIQETASELGRKVDKAQATADAAKKVDLHSENVSGVLPLAKGGTNADSEFAALRSLGIVFTYCTSTTQLDVRTFLNLKYGNPQIMIVTVTSKITCTGNYNMSIDFKQHNLFEANGSEWVKVQSIEPGVHIVAVCPTPSNLNLEGSGAWFLIC